MLYCILCSLVFKKGFLTHTDRFNACEFYNQSRPHSCFITGCAHTVVLHRCLPRPERKHDMSLPVGRKAHKVLASRPNEAASAGPNAWAKAMLEKSGWTAGSGLGKNAQGPTSHVRVSVKTEPTGVGFKAGGEGGLGAWGNEWWHGAYANASASVGAAGAAADSSDDSSDDGARGAVGGTSFEAQYAATGGARLGMRARRTQIGKLLRTEGAGGLPVGAVKQAATTAAPATTRPRTRSRSNVGEEEEEVEVDPKAARKAAKAARKAARAALRVAKQARKAERAAAR